MTSAKTRPVPRPFALHWGKGQIVEEVSYTSEYHEPTLQLLEFGDGSCSIRFCYYNHSGQFQRSPMMAGQDEIAGLREGLEQTPRLHSLLRAMVG